MESIRIIKKVLAKPVAKLDEGLQTNEQISLLRISIGIIYLWFGILKFFENHSPAEELARKTLAVLCFGLIPDCICFLLLAIVETYIGLMLILNIAGSNTIRLAILHLMGTYLPIAILPEIFFKDFPFVLTLIGQYIIKNMVIFCALMIIYSKAAKSK